MALALRGAANLPVLDLSQRPITLDTALTAYIWADDSAIPGRHPEAVPDRALRTHVEGLIDRMDAVTPATTRQTWPRGLTAPSARSLQCAMTWAKPASGHSPLSSAGRGADLRPDHAGTAATSRDGAEVPSTSATTPRVSRTAARRWTARGVRGA